MTSYSYCTSLKSILMLIKSKDSFPYYDTSHKIYIKSINIADLTLRTGRPNLINSNAFLQKLLLTPYTYVTRVTYSFFLSCSYVSKETNPATIEVDRPSSGR